MIINDEDGGAVEPWCHAQRHRDARHRLDLEMLGNGFEQFPTIDRFGEEASESGRGGPLAGGRHGGCGERDDRHRGARAGARTNQASRHATVQLRQMQIHEDQVKRTTRRQINGLAAIGRAINPEAKTSEQLTGNLAMKRIVLDQQHPRSPRERHGGRILAPVGSARCLRGRDDAERGAQGFEQALGPDRAHHHAGQPDHRHIGAPERSQTDARNPP